MFGGVSDTAEQELNQAYKMRKNNLQATISRMDILFINLELGDGSAIFLSKMTKRSGNEKFLPNNILLMDPEVLLHVNTSQSDPGCIS
jgi:hypothetical protein